MRNILYNLAMVLRVIFDVQGQCGCCASAPEKASSKASSWDFSPRGALNQALKEVIQDSSFFRLCLPFSTLELCKLELGNKESKFDDSSVQRLTLSFGPPDRAYRAGGGR